MRFSSLESIAGGTVLATAKDREITTLILDSRKALLTEGALFFAIGGTRHDGHAFIPALYASGVRQFIVERAIDTKDFTDANFLQVTSSVAALQSIARYHRNLYSLPVIGITGSNGKTIIKEWLYQLLSNEFDIAKNPGSYNSQTGVPLAVWQIQQHHTLGIFEAGISRPGEMVKLQSIIQPSIGVITNIGTAHDEGFKNATEKTNEKLTLFAQSALIVYCKDQPVVSALVEKQFDRSRLLSWGEGPDADIQITGDKALVVSIKGKTFSIHIPFSDAASVENVCHCISVMNYFGISPTVISKKVAQLKTVPMRLELKQGNNHCQIIDDTYNNDLAGLQISLEFLAGIQSKKKSLIISEILQSGMDEGLLVERMAELISRSGVSRIVGIGPVMVRQQAILRKNADGSFYENTDQFLNAVNWNEFHDEAILVKGARSFQFEKIVQRLQKKIHGTVMEIDLGAMVDNLNFIKSRLRPGTRLMAMVKAFAYGSGSEEVANLLQYHNIDYLGVAYPDEGIELRKHEIRVPIMVMNPSEQSFAALLEHSLEPEIYNIGMLQAFIAYLDGKKARIHLKLDTGMHRLGLEEDDLPEARAMLKANTNVTVVSIFSHLAGADDHAHDAFTQEQAKRFRLMSGYISEGMNNRPIHHILNSSGIIRFPDLQMDMVRLGIGLYGINPTAQNIGLRPVTTLKTIISQIKKIKQGESVGYGRNGKANYEMTIATIAIGYADGFSRMFSKGVGAVSIHGKLAAVVGNVCMDMTMVDITGIPAREGDEVIIFGNELPIQDVAARINTIPYEILTNTSERVKRLFFAESI